MVLTVDDSKPISLDLADLLAGGGSHITRYRGRELLVGAFCGSLEHSEARISASDGGHVLAAVRDLADRGRELLRRAVAVM